jgi:hypothetical protein
MCQRYYEALSTHSYFWYTTSFIRQAVRFSVTKRAAPSVSLSTIVNSAGSTVSGVTLGAVSSNAFDLNADNVTTTFGIAFSATANAEI